MFINSILFIHLLLYVVTAFRGRLYKKWLKLTMISGNVYQSESCILYLITIWLQNSD